jgi:hypothetical protein
MGNEFSNGNLFSLNVNIYWGVEGINKQDVNYWNPTDLGEAELDDQFDLSSVAA